MKSTQLYTCVVHFWYIPTPHLSSQWFFQLDVLAISIIK